VFKNPIGSYTKALKLLWYTLSSTLAGDIIRYSKTWMQKEAKSLSGSPVIPPTRIQSLSSFSLSLIVALVIVIVAIGGYLMYHAQEVTTQQFAALGGDSGALAEAIQTSNSHLAWLIGLALAILSILVIMIAFLWQRRQRQIVKAIACTQLEHKALLRNFEYFVKYANDSVLLFDQNSKLVQANDRALEDFHYHREQIFSQPLDTFITADSLSKFQDNLKNILQNGVFSMEAIHKRRDGTEFPAEDTARVFKIDDKTYLQIIIRDITERKSKEAEYIQLNQSLEERVRERTSQLENANRELEAFAYSVSHDLRAPLNGIDSWSKALVEDYHDKLGEKGFQILNRIRSETQRLGQMVEDLLKFSRETRSELNIQNINFTEMVQNVSNRLEQANPARKMQLVIHPDMQVLGDSRLLEIVVTNLLDNALKFTSKKPLAVILVGEIHKDGKKVFFVRDNGAGFDMAYAHKLFKVFQRLHKSTEFPGTGVGLATVQRIIARHGGKIWAESQEDQGATFYFTLKEKTG
jgi:PAS domain S-box-containing protein